MTTVAPHQDCPACPECTGPCGTFEDAPPGELRCCACGHTWEPTAAEAEQAHRADAAYDAMREGVEIEASHAPNPDQLELDGVNRDRDPAVVVRLRRERNLERLLEAVRWHEGYGWSYDIAGWLGWPLRVTVGRLQVLMRRGAVVRQDWRYRARCAP